MCPNESEDVMQYSDFGGGGGGGGVTYAVRDDRRKCTFYTGKFSGGGRGRSCQFYDGGINTLSI
jgi:hypothetical protein